LIVSGRSSILHISIQTLMQDHSQIEACIQAIRQRMRYGMTKTQLIVNMSKFFPQETIFLCYNAAVLLEKDSK